MENAIAGLTTAISGDALWGTFAQIVPLISVVLLFSLGLYFVRKLLRGTAKGKAKM